jgi:hypothetical protein
MNITDANKIREKFLSKAPAEYYYHHIEQNHDIKQKGYSGITLFNSKNFDGKQISSIGFSSDDDNILVMMWIGSNLFNFVDYPELCLEIIEKYIPVIHYEDFEVGEKVHYVPFEGCDEKLYENGIVKTIREDSKTHVFVVYACAGEWDNYFLYTGVPTRKSQLRKGWFEPENNQENNSQ